MRRHLVSLSLAGLFGVLLMASDASACHNRKKACAAPCPPAPCATVVVCPQPCPPPAPVCAKPAKHGHRLGGLRQRFLGGHHKPACAPAPCPPAPCDQVVYAEPVQYAAPQSFATPAPQGKSLPVPPAKAMPQG